MSNRRTSQLYTISKKFIDIISSEANNEVDVDQMVTQLHLKDARRIYDVTAPLEGLGLVQKSKRSAKWTAPALSLIHDAMRERGLLIGGETTAPSTQVNDSEVEKLTLNLSPSAGVSRPPLVSPRRTRSSQRLASEPRSQPGSEEADPPTPSLMTIPLPDAVISPDAAEPAPAVEPDVETVDAAPLSQAPVELSSATLRAATAALQAEYDRLAAEVATQGTEIDGLACALFDSNTAFVSHEDIRDATEYLVRQGEEGPGAGEESFATPGMFAHPPGSGPGVFSQCDPASLVVMAFMGGPDSEFAVNRDSSGSFNLQVLSSSPVRFETINRVVERKFDFSFSGLGNDFKDLNF